MAKKHKNLENLPIQWDGDVIQPSDGSTQSTPDNIDIVWGGYVPCWYGGNYEDCVIEDMWFEDFDVVTITDHGFGLMDIHDVIAWVGHGRGDIAAHMTKINDMIICNYPGDTPIQGCTSAPRESYTWGDVSFLIEIADGIGTGSRRAREARLNQFEEEKKKRLIRLICRVKGEKVYDEEKEMGDTYIKLEDAELVINEVLGKIRVENANVL